MVDFAELERKRQERRAFDATPAGKAIANYIRALLREEEYHNQDREPLRSASQKLRAETDRTRQALEDEIKRLQEIEVQYNDYQIKPVE